MADLVVVTTSYPKHRGDAEGHFVGAEVRRLCERFSVTVLAPGLGRQSVWGERVIGLDGGDAFGFPGVLPKLRRHPHQIVPVARFAYGAARWLRQAPAPRRLIAHFLLPCGVPIATQGLRGRGRTELEVVVHGSDARLFARLPVLRGVVGRQLLRADASLRFVSTELQRLVLDCLPALERRALTPRSRVEPSPVDVDAVPPRATARERLGVAADSKIAVVVARLLPSKRVDVALAACARVRGLSAIVIGDGPERQRLERSFPRALFVGHVERPRALEYISAADVLVSASLTEGAPTVVREARALGTHVVCLEAGDLRRWAESDPGLSVVPLR